MHPNRNWLLYVAALIAGLMVGSIGLYNAIAAPATFSDWINGLTTSTADGTTYTREGSTGKKIAHDDANTASTLVRRDSSGNFAAGTITANLTGNASGTSGSTTGNAATATALAANGANCSASSFPLGVDASGAVESCSTDISGNAATATVADASADTTTFPMLATDATGSLGPKTDAGLAYNASTNALTVGGTVSAGGAISLLSTGISFTTTGMQLYGNGNFQIAWLKSVEAVTTTKTPSVSLECEELYTNTGDADGASITLPNDPTVGCCYMFAVTAAQTLTVAPSAGETLYEDGVACGTSYSSATVGSNANICSATGGSGAIWVASASSFTCVP